MIRVAAVGDVHLAPDIAGRHRRALEGLTECADLLLLAGDLTQHGTLEEGKVAAAEYSHLGLPVVAVLGNHDYHSDQQADITAVLEDAGITVLEGSATTLDVDGVTVGVAGAKGFGIGFAGRSASDFGEREMKAFAGHAKAAAASLRGALDAVRADVTIALTHYAPVDDTLAGEPPEIWPFLGSYLLGEAIDAGGACFVVHGHAHHGTERGLTDGGVRVRNVAMPVLRQAYGLYELEPAALVTAS